MRTTPGIDGLIAAAEVAQGGAGTTAPPAPPALPQTAVLTTPEAATPSQRYDALVNQRREVRSQLSELESRRNAIAQRLRQGNAAEGADQAGLESRLAELDKQIAKTYTEVAAVESAVQQAAAVPGSRPPPPPPRQRDGPPEEAYILGMVVTLAVLLPMAIAFSRRIWRRSASIVASLPKDLAERLTRLEQSVESVAIDVERVGDGQRFVTNLFIENGGPQMLGAGAMEPLDARHREGVHAERMGHITTGVPRAR
jgi:hypothetical protein